MLFRFDLFHLILHVMEVFKKEVSRALSKHPIISRRWHNLVIPVTKLREHWDETNSKVMQRKTQLDAMLTDSQRYESKRLEVEAWLGRMDTRLERMGPVGHTADVLEAQLREQKVPVEFSVTVLPANLILVKFSICEPL